MIYRIKARPSWNRKSTTKRFFDSGYIGFLLIATTLLIANGTVKKFRVYSLAMFALALPLLAIETLAVATIGALVSELAGRYLFYRTVVPLGLAGNFFAGNQRD